MTKVKITTMLDRDLADLEDRFIAQFIDVLIPVFFIIFSAFLLDFPTTISQILGVFGIWFAIFYILCADGLKGGQSYGKKIRGICVINATSGKPCNFIRSFIRNISLVFLGIIDWIFIFSNKRQRLGDMIANTIVVRKKDRSKAS